MKCGDFIYSCIDLFCSDAFCVGTLNRMCFFVLALVVIIMGTYLSIYFLLLILIKLP